MKRVLMAASLLVLGGCGPALFEVAAESTVQSRHASEFGCDYDSVEVRTLNHTTYRATGCGARAIYVCGDGAVCVRDGPVERRQPRTGGPKTEM